MVLRIRTSNNCSLWSLSKQKFNKQEERPQKVHKGDNGRGNNPITSKKNKLGILAAVDSCFGLVMLRRHGLERITSDVKMVHLWDVAG